MGSPVGSPHSMTTYFVMERPLAWWPPSAASSKLNGMRIVYLAAGAAGMYCGSCLHDNTLAAGLLELGQDVLLVPTYTPLRTDENNVSLARVFYGGINVYLQQKSSFFRNTPWLVDRLFDQPALLDFVARRGASTDPAKLGDLTVSMLAGESGRQKKELDKLLAWLAAEARPDVVHLSNSMLLGMAGQIADRLRVPVLSTLSGEDIFLEKLAEPHYSRARELLRSRAQHVNAFVALNDYYAGFMSDYLDVPRSSIHVIPHGLRLDGHHLRDHRPADELTIGYFARVCHDKGLHLLAAALPLLAADSRLPKLKLRAAGYLGAGDREYLHQVRQSLAAAGLTDRFHYVGEVDRQGKIDFFHSIDVMSVPTVYRESKGISILEALANGVPVVQPAHGAFPEMLSDTQGGLLFTPHDAGDLAEKLARLLTDHTLRQDLGRAGHFAINDRYHHRAMAARTLALYQHVLAADTQSDDAAREQTAVAAGKRETQ